MARSLNADGWGFRLLLKDPRGKLRQLHERMTIGEAQIGNIEVALALAADP